MVYNYLKALFLFISLYIVVVHSWTCGNNAIKIAETEINGRISQVRWVNGKDIKIIYVLTTERTLYRSADEGLTWTDQTSLMDQSDVEQNGRKGIRSIISSADQTVVYFMGYNGLLWATTDDGQHYSLSPSRIRFNTLKPHPKLSGLLLGDAPSDGCRNASLGECFNSVYLTTDYAYSWKPIRTYTSQYTWANAGVEGIPNGNLWTLEFLDKTGNQRTKSRYDMDLMHSTDFGQSAATTPINNIINLLSSSQYLYVVEYQISGGGLSLYISDDNGKTFTEAQFPYDFLAENQYTILDDSQSSIFINVRHTSSQWGHVYASNYDGSNFDLSLSYNWRDNSGNSQFTPLNGVNGIYVANQLQNVETNTAAGVKTLISFNKGGDWSSLPVPLDLSNQPLSCTDTDCQLNLHLNSKLTVRDSTFYGPFYTSENAVGLILATGNIGQYLNNRDRDVTKTFISQDAGLTWYTILNGSYVYEFGAAGSIVLFADNTQDVDTIQFSFDEGFTMSSCKFTNGTAMQVTDIKSDPSGKSSKFLLYGYRSNSDGTITGVLSLIDFDGYKRQCVYPDDYYMWTPRDNLNSSTSNCLLGVSESYSRKKRTADCISSSDYEITTVPQSCPCKMEDYECDYCFQRIGSVCSRLPDCEISTDPPADCDSHYYVTRGYRLVPGNGCDYVKGLNLMPKQYDCPNKHKGSSSKHDGIGAGMAALISVLVLGMIILISAVVYFIRKNQQRFSFVKNIPFMRTKKGELIFDDTYTTALDEDLLEQREPETLDDQTIQEKINSKVPEKSDETVVDLM